MSQENVGLMLDLSIRSETRHIKSLLTRGVEEFTRALEDLERGERINEHLIHNLQMLTGHIAKYNMSRELQRVLKAEER